MYGSLPTQTPIHLNVNPSTVDTALESPRFTKTQETPGHCPPTPRHSQTASCPATVPDSPEQPPPTPESPNRERRHPARTVPPQKTAGNTGLGPSPGNRTRQRPLWRSRALAPNLAIARTKPWSVNTSYPRGNRSGPPPEEPQYSNRRTGPT